VADVICSPIRPKTACGLPVTWLPTAAQIAWIAGISCSCLSANNPTTFYKELMAIESRPLYHCYMPASTSSSLPDSKSRILESARAELNAQGILGLRVSEVAKNADTSITLIYRYFTDRNGLLARVLGDMYDEFRLNFQTKVNNWLAITDEITIEQFVCLMPNPAEETKHARDFRLQVLATSLNNQELHDRIKKITQESHEWMISSIEASRHKLPEQDRNFDARFLTVFMFNVMFVYYDLVDEKISADEYRAMLVNQIRSSALISS
jgi:AcrR family transcriptional regulator